MEFKLIARWFDGRATYEVKDLAAAQSDLTDLADALDALAVGESITIERLS